MSLNVEDANRTAATLWGHSRTVWLVDDDLSLAVLIAEFLEMHAGIHVQKQFESAEALLEALRNESDAPDVILMDVQMRGMSGLDALSRLADIAPGVAVVIMTTFYDRIYERNALSSGASSFVVKSSRPEAFVEAVLSSQPIHERTLKSAVKTSSTDERRSSLAFAREWISRSITELGKFGQYKVAARHSYASSVRSVCE